MKHDLTIESYRAWESYGIDEGFKAIKEAGFDGADVSFYWEAAKAFLGDDYREKAREIKAALDKYGLSHHQAHAPFSFTQGMEPDDSVWDYLIIKRAIEACSIIGIDQIVVHGIPVLPFPNVSKENVRRNIEFYKGLEPTAAKFGVRILVENGGRFMSYPDLLNDVVNELNPEHFGALVDVGHAWLVANMQPGEFIRQLTPGILYGLHIQDNHGAGYGVDEHIPPYLGTVDFDDLIEALREVEYEGDFTIEVPKFLSFYADKGLLDPALTFTCAVGRKLVDDLEV
ncbi:MAG: sugar phosphate isomerase/epimerase family protein [Eubacteriales bacterium]|nr:sugar phosphate isomerase/epimerase family protein [Eubacteriales bacterium]